MRKNKFRAWDTERKKMYSAEELGKDELTLNPDGRGFVNVSSTSVKLSVYMDHLIPLEYTGLKDKNDKEIYEGDIIRDFWKEVEVEVIGEIIFEEGHFELKFIELKPKPSLKWCSCGIGLLKAPEVIGNIYQNPELIKGGKNDN